MRNAHDGVGVRAVGRACLRCYYSAMKPQPHSHTAPRPQAAHFYESIRSTAEGSLHTNARHHPPPARYPRYPALSDDDQPPLISARAIAALVLIALIVAMAIGL